MSEKTGLVHSELSSKVIAAFFDVYNELGYGYLESAYLNSMPIALGAAGLKCKSQVPLTVFFRGQPVGEFRADLVVENKIIIETKAADRIHPVHELQVLNYLKASKLEVGLLLNFGPKPEFKRIVLSSR